MTEKKLITAGKNPESISENIVYLTLIAERIDNHAKAHSHDEYINLPKKFAYNYLEYNGTYWSVMETCLRNFEEVKRPIFTDDYKEVAIELCQEDLETSVDDLLRFVSNKIRGQSKNICFDLNENAHAHPVVLKLLRDQLLSNERRERRKRGNEGDKKQKIETNTVSLIKIPKSTLTNFERKLINVAQKGLMEEALQFAERRAKLSGDKYKFRKLRESLSDIYKDYVIHSTTGKPKKSILGKDDADLIKHVVNNYEVIGNNIYLLNQRKYEKAVREHFVPKLKKARNSLAKS
ncbi:MAG: hypothetical protein FH748_12785 [Balneolaceae bacterium]|nr:hypothetical protein [Balneolaceae bacterium]